MAAVPLSLVGVHVHRLNSEVYPAASDRERLKPC